MTVISNIVGYITNQLLMPGFKPVLDYDASQKTIRAANKLIFTAPLWLKYLCSFVLIAYACVALVRIIKNKLAARQLNLFRRRVMTKKPTRLAPYKRIALYTVLLLSVCLLAFSASRYLQKQAEEKTPAGAGWHLPLPWKRTTRLCLPLKRNSLTEKFIWPARKM